MDKDPMHPQPLPQQLGERAWAYAGLVGVAVLALACVGYLVWLR